MKHSSPIRLAACSLLLFVLCMLGTVSAQTIVSINYSRDPNPILSSNTPAGITFDDGQAENWNNVFAGTTSAVSGFMNSDGDAVSNSFSVTMGANGGARTSSSGTAAYEILGFNGNRNFSSLANGDSFLTLTNTAAVFGEDEAFDFYLYVGRQSIYTGTTDLQVRVHGSLAVESASADANEIGTSGTYEEGTQFIAFRNLSATTGNLVFDVASPTAGDFAVVGGIQLVQVQVPEPTTRILSGIVMLALLAYRRESFRPRNA